MFAPGQIWMKKTCQHSVVRQIISVDEKKIHYKVLHGPKNLKFGTCRIRTFLNHFRQIEPMKDYSLLDGAKHFDTYVVLATSGKPLFRCGEKRAKFYLRKGYVNRITDHQLQFTNDVTEQTLQRIYKSTFSDFFMEKKNDKCACCGKTARLTRHHIVPKCHKKKIPEQWKKCISNVLFICIECHNKYDHEWKPEEPQSNESWKGYILAWRNHFINTMKPKFLPSGWDIFTQSV